MPRDGAAMRRFVRGLLREPARRDGRDYVLPDGRRETARHVAELIHSGVIDGDQRECRANAATSAWLRRVALGAAAPDLPRGLETPVPGAATVNLAESPLARLAAGAEAFLDAHHVQAGERVRRLFERAQLQPHVTMTYSASRIAGGQMHAASDISDLAADARREMNRLCRLLPPDCAGVVIDVCGFLKGLQEVERERGWPRRSAKLVLRIGLEQLAQHYGLGPFALGKVSARLQGWMGEGARPDRFG